MNAETNSPPRRRQARGERRIAQLLEAAGAVFTDSGYSATTTNAIAARAGVSPGTLYQYFPNKEAIAVALASSYADQLDELLAPFAVVDPELTPLEKALAVSLGPIVEFHRRNPACLVLFQGDDTPRDMLDHHAPLELRTRNRIAALIALYAPGLSGAEQELAAAVALAAYKGVLPLLVRADEAQVAGLTRELTDLLLGYLDRVVDRG